MSALPGNLPHTDPMPVLFVGHGSPMNAIEDNAFARTWAEVAASLPRPEAILCISAHWETWGTLLTAMPRPRTIHDFGGFPQALFDVQYEAPGSPVLAEETRTVLSPAAVGLDHDWGLDHGAWSVLRRMYPAADVPVVQLSLNYTLRPQEHYDLARKLAPLRRRGVLIVGSGNMVHNLRRVVMPTRSVDDFNAPFGLPWALEARSLMKDHIDRRDHQPLIEYHRLGPSVALAVPTPEHYLPMLYALALQDDRDALSYFNDQAVAGSLTMTGLRIEARA